MPWLELSKGLRTEVSEEDFAWACQWKWTAKRSAYNDYAIRRPGGRGRRPAVYLHREIAARMCGVVSLPADLVVHHQDRDSLNNRRRNIAVCTQKENLAARRSAVRTATVAADDVPF